MRTYPTRNSVITHHEGTKDTQVSSFVSFVTFVPSW
jgi:hypothetical protein